MNAESLLERSPSLADAESRLALGSGALLLLVGASRRSVLGACLAVASAPPLYRGITGHWPDVLNRYVQSDSTKTALGGERGVHVRESIRLEVSIADVYRFWRRLENLPRFMTHLNRVTETPGGPSHWVAAGPAGLTVEWRPEVINEKENELLAWRSLPGSDVVTAGSVTFETVRGGPPSGDAARSVNSRLTYLLGAERVIAIDRFAERLELASSQGGAETLNDDEVDVLDALRQLTGGQGPDACIDAVGLEAHGTTLDAWYDRAKTSMFLDPPRHVVGSTLTGQQTTQGEPINGRSRYAPRCIY